MRSFEPHTTGERIRIERLSQGIKQSRLASLSGLTASAISDIERCQREPSWKAMQRIAKALGVSLDSLKDR